MDDLKLLLSRYSQGMNDSDGDDIDLNLNNVVSAALAGKILAASAAQAVNNADGGPADHVTDKAAEANALGTSALTSLPNGSSGGSGGRPLTHTFTETTTSTNATSTSTSASVTASVSITSGSVATPTTFNAQPASVSFSSGTDGTATGTSSIVSSTASSSALSDTSSGATQSKSFMDNKPLAISVITVSSVGGLALIIVLLTCLLRRRRRNKLHQDTAQISDDQIMGPPPIMDIEKTSPKGSPGIGHYGAMSRAGSLRRSSNDSGKGGGLGVPSGPEMYQRSTSPVFVPADAQNIQSAHPQLSPGQRHSFYEDGSIGAGSFSRVPDRPPQIPNPFDDSNAAPANAAPLDVSFAAVPPPGVVAASSGARASPIQRKPPPHLSIDLDVLSSQSHSTHRSEPSPDSAVSHDGNPLQHATTLNTARPVGGEQNVASAQSVLSYVALTPPAQIALTSPKAVGPAATGFASGTGRRSSMDSHKRSSSVESRADAPPFPVPVVAPLNLDDDLSPVLRKGDKGKKPMRTLKVANP